MLKADHKKVKALFDEFADATAPDRKVIARTAIQELELHAGLEEVLIYPAIRKKEHHLVHVLIAELKELEPNDETFAAEFTVLGELVKHHVKEEEGTMFPTASKPGSIGRSLRPQSWSARTY